MKVIFEVVEVRGQCPLYKPGDRIVIEEFWISEKSARPCIHALPTLLHYALALREGADPIKLGLTKRGGEAYLHCPDPGPPYTPGGSVIFKAWVEEG
ncbi:MAG: TIGR04076 family protein [Thermoplasmata archaeon]|nr:TIGR04076 family protein [Thermoplasmata archaeon]